MSRARLLHVLSVLETETNVSCGLTLQEICRKLFEKYPEEQCSEQRVRKDISVLQALSAEKVVPFELKYESGPHNQRKYKLYRPTFGLNEARMVFDSIAISQFLSPAQKNALISQLEGFLSQSEVRQLKQRVQVRPCLMQDERLPQTLQIIYQAIATASLADLMKERPEQRAEARQDRQFLNAQKIGEHEAEIEKIKNVFMSILRDIKKEIDSGEQPGETVTAAMLQNIQNAAQEQKQELHTVDDVAALVAEQIEKVMPLDEETSEQFQQLMKKMIEQAGK